MAVETTGERLVSLRLQIQSFTETLLKVTFLDNCTSLRADSSS